MSFKKVMPEPELPELQHIEHIVEEHISKNAQGDYIARLRRINNEMDELRKDIANAYVKAGMRGI